MTWPRLALLLLVSWALLTAGLTIAFGSWSVPFLSAGVLGLLWAAPSAWKFYVDGLAEKDEAKR